MATLTASPTVVRIINKAAGAVTIVVSTTKATGPITASLADGSFVTLSPSSIAGTSGTFTVTPTSYSGGDDTLTLSDGTTSLVIPVALGASPQPKNPSTSDYTLGKLMTYIRFLADAPTNPTDGVLAMLVNQAVVQIGDALNPGFSTIQLPVVVGTGTVTLPPDVSDFSEIAFNSGDLNVPGNIPYELVELGAGEFMKANQGTSGSYGVMPGGPTLYFQRLSDTGGRIRLQFSPYPPAGYLVLTYRPRVPLYDPANLDSTSTLDPAYYKLVALMVAQEVCQGARDFRRAQSYQAMYQGALMEKKATLGRRSRAHGATVRDVMNDGVDAFPNWYPR